MVLPNRESVNNGRRLALNKEKNISLNIMHSKEILIKAIMFIIILINIVEKFRDVRRKCARRSYFI